MTHRERYDMLCKVDDAFRCIGEDLGFDFSLDVDPQEVVDAVGGMTAMLDCRAGKLLKKRKAFIVVACDEPYFPAVYDLIRLHETRAGRWTEQDEEAFLEAMAAATAEQQRFAHQLYMRGWESQS